VIARSICLPADSFGLHRREEALHCRVVRDVARPAHRAGDAIVGHQPLELLAHVLASLVRVMQQGVGLSASPDCHHQRIGHELSGHGVAHRPSDHAAREQVDDDSDVEPPFGRPDAGEVGDPPLVGRLGGELAVEDVVGDDRPQALILGQATTSRTGPQVIDTNQPFDAMQTI